MHDPKQQHSSFHFFFAIQIIQLEPNSSDVSAHIFFYFFLLIHMVLIKMFMFHPLQ